MGTQPEDSAAFVTWNAPDDDGDLPVTGYRISDASGQHDVGPDVRSYESTGLTNGKAYWITVQAMNAIGPGPAAGQEVTPGPGAQRQDDGNLCGVIAPGSTTTLTAVGSPYRICHAGVTVAPGGTLVVDVTAGPIQLTALGSTGITVDQADLRTELGGTTNRLSYSESDSTGSPWTAIAALPAPKPPTCPLCIPPPRSASWVELAQTDLHAGLVETANGTGLLLSDSTIDAAPAMNTYGTPLQFTNVSITNPKGYGLNSECDGDCELSLTNVTVDNAPSTGVRLLGSSDLTIHGLTVTRSGTSSHSPAVELIDTRTTFGPGQRVNGVGGASNAIDAIGLDNVSSQADLTWLTPSDGSQIHPLGFVIERGLTMASHTTMTVPAGGVVKVATGGGLTLDGATLDASAGGATLTAAGDNTVGPPTCPSVLAPSCTVTAGSWQGVRMLSATVNLVGARVAGAGLGDQTGFETNSSNVAVKDSTIEDCNIAVHASDYNYPDAPSTRSVAVSGSTIRACAAGIVVNGVATVSLTGNTLSGAHRAAGTIDGINVAATANSSVLIDDNVVTGFAGFGLSVQGAVHPEIRNDVLRNNAYAAILSGTMSLGPGLDISGLTGAANGVNALRLQGTITQDMTWVSPRASASDAPLGYFIGEDSGSGPCGLKFTASASLILPANAAVSELAVQGCGATYALTFDGGRLDGTAGGAVLSSVADSPGASSWENLPPSDIGWNGIQLRPDATGKMTASLSLDRARIDGAAFAINADGSVSIADSTVSGSVSIRSGAVTLSNDTFKDGDVWLDGQPTTVTNDVFNASPLSVYPVLTVGPSGTSPPYYPGVPPAPLTIQHIVVNDARAPAPQTGDRAASVMLWGVTASIGPGQQID
ncbi:MAG: fibronectin type III domain-containing protein, partial [Frankiaceae bacterium]|nr:fibronectin type III domain-containing protein [Frankiaceae bacterium]